MLDWSRLAVTDGLISSRESPPGRFTSLASAGGDSYTYLDLDETEAQVIEVDTDVLGGAVDADFVDPVSGETRGHTVLAGPGTATIMTPGMNAGGDGDWLLITRRSTP